MPGTARLLRDRPGEQARRDRRGHRPVRRDLAGRGRRGGRVGHGARTARPQQALNDSSPATQALHLLVGNMRVATEAGVPAVIFAPDRDVRSSRRRIGLVLGAGGVLGAAWMTGALVRLQERLPGPAGEVDLIVGTSAGSVLAAALRCRAALPEITAWQHGDATGELSESAALAAQDGPLPPLPYP